MTDAPTSGWVPVESSWRRALLDDLDALREKLEFMANQKLPDEFNHEGEDPGDYEAGYEGVCLDARKALAELNAIIEKHVRQ